MPHSQRRILADSSLACSDSLEARYIAACVPLANGVRLAAIGSGVLRNDAAVKAISREGDPKCVALRPVLRCPHARLLSTARCRELLRGPLIYVVAMVFATVVFWRNSPVGVVAISLMCGGDGAYRRACAVRGSRRLTP